MDGILGLISLGMIVGGFALMIITRKLAAPVLLFAVAIMLSLIEIFT